MTLGDVSTSLIADESDLGEWVWIWLGFSRDGQGSGWTVGGVILEIFTMGDQSQFYGGGMVGVKIIFNHFFPSYEILPNFFAFFIILSPQFEIVMGIPPHCKPFKIVMMGVSLQRSRWGYPHHPLLCPSLGFRFGVGVNVVSF